jgi:serine/threonine protein kinase
VAFSPGDIIDEKYRIVRLIGEGGMGYVYEGLNLRIKRRVAIKVLNADIAASADMKRRFEREAQVAAKIGSPHICDVLDLGDLPSGESYLVMEFLEGEGLDTRIDRALDGRVPPAELSVLTYQMLEGLAAMHEAGIIHRDIKPANAFIARSSAAGNAREVVKLLDFGISKFQNDEAKHVTQTGALLGTPVYMSPEQARGERTVDHRSDIYAVGVILYRAITGRLPFEGDNFQQLLFKIALEAAPPLAELAPEIDETFRAIVEKAMAKSPDDRFASARAMQEAFVAWDRSQGRTSLQFRAAVQGALSSDVISAAAAITSSRKPGLDEKSAPVAWGKPSTGNLKVDPSGARPAGALAEAKTPPPAGSDATMVDAALVSQRTPSTEGNVAAVTDTATGAATAQPGASTPIAPKKKSAMPIIAAAAVILLVGSGVGYKQLSKPADAGQAGPVGVGVTQPQATTQAAQAPPPTTAAPTAAGDPVSAQLGATPSGLPAPGTSAAVTPTTAVAQGHAQKGGPASQARPNASVTAPASAAPPVVATPAAATPLAAPSADPAKTGRKIRTEL